MAEDKYAEYSRTWKDILKEAASGKTVGIPNLVILAAYIALNAAFVLTHNQQKGKHMRIPVEKVSIEFTCPNCDHSEMVPVTNLPDIGQPLCSECGLNVEMEMGIAYINEANSC